MHKIAREQAKLVQKNDSTSAITHNDHAQIQEEFCDTTGSQSKSLAPAGVTRTVGRRGDNLIEQTTNASDDNHPVPTKFQTGSWVILSDLTGPLSGFNGFYTKIVSQAEDVNELVCWNVILGSNNITAPIPEINLITSADGPSDVELDLAMVTSYDSTHTRTPFSSVLYSTVWMPLGMPAFAGQSPSMPMHYGLLVSSEAIINSTREANDGLSMENGSSDDDDGNRNGSI